jgi:hypothetical protein
MPDRPVFRLDIQPDAREASSPAINRLRIILKRLLRQFGYRCLRIEEIGATSMTVAPGGGEHAAPKQE